MTAAARFATTRSLDERRLCRNIDHAAADGSGARDADSLHRIDRQTVIDELTAAGLVLEPGPDPLRNPADPRTAIVFDPSIRSHAEQFMLKFRKPA